jgi:hypothetical protein
LSKLFLLLNQRPGRKTKQKQNKVYRNKNIFSENFVRNISENNKKFLYTLYFTLPVTSGDSGDSGWVTLSIYYQYIIHGKRY